MLPQKFLNCLRANASIFLRSTRLRTTTLRPHMNCATELTDKATL